MNFLEKKKQLRTIIEEKLTPLIDNDYVLYGLPYYNNIGDTLIWEGELEFLKKLLINVSEFVHGMPIHAPNCRKIL